METKNKLDEPRLQKNPVTCYLSYKKYDKVLGWFRKLKKDIYMVLLCTYFKHFGGHRCNEDWEKTFARLHENTELLLSFCVQLEKKVIGPRSVAMSKFTIEI